MLQTTFSDHRGVLTLVLAAALLASSLAGCDRGEPWQQPAPDETFERFLLDWYQGNRQDAFEAIAPEDRRELLEPYETLEGRLDAEHLPDTHEMLPAGRVDNPYDVDRIDLSEPLDEEPDAGERVTLDLSYHDGREGEATMVWGGERWYVDLPLADEREASADDTNANDGADAGSPQPQDADASQQEADAGSDGGAGEDAGR